MITPRPLPAEVQRLCAELGAPPRLVAHLTLVHEVAAELVAALRRAHPALAFNADDVLFGAATHDLGKVVCGEELSGPGRRHEAAGERLLIEHGIPPARARFARTHGEWTAPDAGLEDLLVALADSAWKGQRREELELRAARRISAASGGSEWEAWSWLDEQMQRIGARAAERLEWQGRFGM